MNIIVSIKNLKKIYKNNLVAINNLNLDIFEGEIIALLGPNGAGKTTLISTICGLSSISSGSIKVKSFDVVDDYRKTREIIGLVPQELALEPFEKVINSIKFSRRLFGKKNDPIYLDNLLKKLHLFDKKNVVILVCGSLGKEYIGYYSKGESHTPFLDSLLGEGMNFVNMYANGSRSTQGIASITGGLPALMTDPYIFSAYQNNNLTGIGEVLKKEGYTNAFFHGGEVGTMGFSHFMPMVGVSKYYGRTQYVQDNDYPLKQDYDGNWGIWDIPFYDYAIKKINTFEAPFFATLFSINVHHPFNTEPWFEERYPDLDKRIRAIKYADYNLKLFFEKVSEEPWFRNTVFVITADHAGPSNSSLYTNNEGRYKIPLLLYSPSDSSLIGVKHQITEQIDILPTILHYLGYPEPFLAFGVSKLDTVNKEHYNYTFEKGIYQIIDKEYVLQFNGNKSIALYNRLKDVYLKKNILLDYPEVAKKLEKQLKSVIQVHNKSMIDNDLGIK